MIGEGRLDARAIRRALEDALGPRLAAAHDLRVVAQTVSTNDDILHLAGQGAPEGTVVFAESQSAGRGRRGDAWISPPGTNLLFSLLLHPTVPLAAWTRLPHLAGLAVCRALEQRFPALPPLMLKWPNDVYLSDRKVAGILVESLAARGQSPVAVLGIGLNVNLTPERFPAEIRELATTLRAHTGHLIDRNALAAAILAEWAGLYPAELASDFSTVRGELRQRAWLRGKAITVLSGTREIPGVAVDVGPEGELILETETGERQSILSADRVRW